MIEGVRISNSEPESIFQDLLDRVPIVELVGAQAVDYMFYGEGRRVYIERKETSDFIHSFLTGEGETGEPRITAQIRKMAELDGLKVLLREGTLGCRQGKATVGKKTFGILYATLDNFLMRIQGWGIRLAHSPSQAYTAARMVAIAESWLSSDEPSPIIHLPPAPSPQLRTLITFPTIGLKRAQGIARRTGNLEEALLALLTANLKVTGLGETGEKRVREYMEEPWHESSG